jgi:hypothetical protein
MSQSTNPQPELEATDQDWIDDHDTEHLEESSGVHLVRITIDRIEHRKDTRIIYYTCDFCGHQHRHGLPWTVGYGYVVTRVPHCANSYRPRNIEIELRLPHGYKDHWLAGHAVPGTDYPDPNVDPATIPDVDRFHADNPTRTDSCPDGCITVHKPGERNSFHTGKVYTSIAPTEVGKPKFMFRAQNFYDADPRDPYHWSSVEVFDLEHGTWQRMDMTVEELKTLSRVVNALHRGNSYLDPTTADNHSEPTRTEGNNE